MYAMNENNTTVMGEKFQMEIKCTRTLISNKIAYHKPTKEAIKYDAVPGIKVWMHRKLCLGHESYWSNCHNKKVKYKANEASKSQNSSNDSTNDGQKCSAAQINKNSNFRVSKRANNFKN